MMKPSKQEPPTLATAKPIAQEDLTRLALEALRLAVWYGEAIRSAEFYATQVEQDGVSDRWLGDLKRSEIMEDIRHEAIRVFAAKVEAIASEGSFLRGLPPCESCGLLVGECSLYCSHVSGEESP